jgi:DNA-binding Lrp family transcriptional regulator
MALGKKLDEIDIKIIKDLLRDGRKNFAAIAKECNVSKTTIGEHYKKL